MAFLFNDGSKNSQYKSRFEAGMKCDAFCSSSVAANMCDAT